MTHPNPTATGSRLCVYGCSVQSQACRGMKVIVLPLQSTSSKRLNRQ